MDYQQRALNDAEQVLLEKENLEKLIRSSYDTLFGYLQSISDVYARATMARHLDLLYQQALSSIPESPSESAETADVKTNPYPANPGVVSTASSITPSGSSQGASSRDPSYSPGDEDTGHR